MSPNPAPAPNEPRPDGEYAVVEIFGHIRHVGRYREVERFGQKFCEIEPIHNEAFQTPVLVGGASIFRFTPVTAEYAWANAPQDWQHRYRDNPRLGAPATPEILELDEAGFLGEDAQPDEELPAPVDHALNASLADVLLGMHELGGQCPAHHIEEGARLELVERGLIDLVSDTPDDIATVTAKLTPAGIEALDDHIPF